MKNKKIRIVNWPRFVMSMLFIALLLAVIILPPFKGREISDTNRISWCESQDVTKYADIKEILKDYLERKTGERPERVVFIVNEEDAMTYNMDIYFELVDDNSTTWYYRNFDSLDAFFNRKVDNAIGRGIILANK